MNDEQLTATANICQEMLFAEWNIEMEVDEAREITSSILEEKNFWKCWQANIICDSEFARILLAKFETRVGHLRDLRLYRERDAPIDDSYAQNLLIAIAMRDSEDRTP